VQAGRDAHHETARRWVNPQYRKHLGATPSFEIRALYDQQVSPLGIDECYSSIRKRFWHFGLLLAFGDDPLEDPAARDIRVSEPMMAAEELAKVAVVMACQPAHLNINILDAIVLPVKQAYLGRA
jgi:hypothetical protein